MKLFTTIFSQLFGTFRENVAPIVDFPAELETAPRYWSTIYLTTENNDKHKHVLMIIIAKINECIVGTYKAKAMFSALGPAVRTLLCNNNNKHTRYHRYSID